MSGVDLPKDNRTFQEKVREVVLGKKEATIVDLSEPINMFPDDTPEPPYIDRP